MNELINAEEVAAIYGVSRILFNSARLGVGAPAPVVTDRQRNPTTGKLGSMIVLYDAAACRAWAAENDFWLMAMDYRHRQRHGDAPRVRTAARRSSRTRPVDDTRSVELEKRDAEVALRPELKAFLQGRFAPAPVLIAQDMKLIRARMNKPKTQIVRYAGDGW